jgi:hypothetical protein
VLDAEKRQKPRFFGVFRFTSVAGSRIIEVIEKISEHFCIILFNPQGQNSCSAPEALFEGQLTIQGGSEWLTENE